MLEEFLIDVSFMKLGWVVAILLVVMDIFIHAFNDKIVEWAFAVLKAFVYGKLGFLMWEYVSSSGFQKVDVVTAFTCMFCFLEWGDNLSKVIGRFIQGIKERVILIKKNK